MKGTVMPPQPRQFKEQAGRTAPRSANDWRLRALRLLGLLALGMTLAACDRCGDFLPSSQSQIGACHSDPPRQ
jgi:hypothetical protein